MKPLPQGIVALLPFQEAGISITPNGELFSNSGVHIVQARISWASIEPTEGTYEWILFDQAIALANENKKRVALSTTFGTETPAWCYAAGALKQKITMNNGTVQYMPWPWDPVYRAKIVAFVKAFGQRYDSNPTVAYVVMSGFGRQQESCCVESAGDIATFDSLGGQTLWEDAVIGSQFPLEFRQTALVMPIDVPTPDQQGLQSLTTAIAYLKNKYPNKFGIRSDGLRLGYESNAPVPELLMQYKNSLTGFQFSLPANGTPMSEYFAVAEPYNPNFIECFQDDVLNPSNQAALQQVNEEKK